MKIILHVGMPKAGSTAIQAGMQQLSGPLATQGYLYPKGIATDYNHGFLTAGVQSPERIPRIYKHLYRNKPDSVAGDFKSWMRALRKEIDKTRPHTLILSAEALFKCTQPEEFQGLAKILESLGETVEIVVYVRKPSDYYASAVQQRLKASHRLIPLEPIAYRGPIEAFEKYVSPRLHVHDFDVSRHDPKGILGHFAKTYFADVADRLDIPVIRKNKSLSAEGIAILSDYRKKYHSAEHNKFSADTKLIIKSIQAADDKMKTNTLPKLKAEVANLLDYGSQDVMWLRERFGIEFDALSYERVGEKSFKKVPHRVEELFDYDIDKKMNTMLHVLHALAGRVDPAPRRKGRP